jgi:hypothetical protein
MKYLANLSQIAAIVLACLAPVAAIAQTNVQSQSYASTTTYYVPFGDATPTTSTTTTSNIYSGTNVFPIPTNGYYGSGVSDPSLVPTVPSSYSGTNLYINSTPFYGGAAAYQTNDRSTQSTTIIQSGNGFPPAIRSTCSTAIVGSPIASPVAVDRISGLPCQ